MSDQFREIPAHIGFRIKNLFPGISDALGRGDLAEIAPGGGGPHPSHCHEGGHLFLVLDGEVDLFIEDTCHRLSCYSSMAVPAFTHHHMINNSDVTATVLGIQIT